MAVLNRGLIVSCQAFEDEPLYGRGIMPKMARAAEDGGAIGIRANGIADIAEIKATSILPVIGIIKKTYPGYEVYITPSMREIEELAGVRPDIIAFDATLRPRPDNRPPEIFIHSIKEKMDVPIMADISNYQEGVNACNAGADYIATTLSGFTDATKGNEQPDLKLIRMLVDKVHVPVIAEGHIETPEQAMDCLKAGAYAVVVGSAITRPQTITRRFVNRLNDVLRG